MCNKQTNVDEDYFCVGDVLKCEVPITLQYVGTDNCKTIAEKGSLWIVDKVIDNRFFQLYETANKNNHFSIPCEVAETHFKLAVSKGD